MLNDDLQRDDAPAKPAPESAATDDQPIEEEDLESVSGGQWRPKLHPLPVPPIRLPYEPTPLPPVALEWPVQEEDA